MSLDESIASGQTGHIADHEAIAQVINVFGCVDAATYGNGSTDATAHIQAQIDAAAAKGGGQVLFPAGTYAVTGLLLPSHVVLLGMNTGSQIAGPTEIKYTGAAGGKVISPKDRTTNTINCGVVGIEVNGNALADICIEFYRVSYSRLVRLHVRNTRSGGVGIVLDGNVAGQCYFNELVDVKPSSVTTGVRLTQGANVNRIIGGRFGNSDVALEFLSLSAGNLVLNTDFETSSVKHVYVDAPSNVFVGVHMEAAPIGFDITVNGRHTHRICTTLSTDVTTWVQDASTDSVYLDQDSPEIRTLRLGYSAIKSTDFTSGTTLTVDPHPVASTSNVIVRFFSKLVSTGIRQFVLYRGDGTSTPAFQVNVGDGNVILGDADVGGGKGVFALRNRDVVPSTNPPGGGVLYAESGALKWRGSSGTVTTIAPA